jgi:excinuclease ABC subunit C
MTRTDSSLKKLPDAPGVYFFLSTKKEVLYVGKATSLRDRVKSYFSSTLPKSRGPQIVQMVEKAKKVEFRETGSVLEALILEAKLIKELKPLYNVRDKDDKSFNYLLITTSEEFPRLLTVRGKELKQYVQSLTSAYSRAKPPLVFGPFPHAGQFKEALKIIRKIFPFYDTKDVVQVLREKKDRKLLFNASIGVYPDMQVTKSAYKKTIRYITALFNGNLKKLLRTLEKDMHLYASQERFEDASRVKRQLFALQHIEDISLLRREVSRSESQPFRIEGYDVAHFGGDDTVGVMVVVDEGSIQKQEYRTFTIRHAVSKSDTGALEELFERRLAHPEWPYPRLFVVDGGKAQRNTALAVLKRVGVEIPVVAVTKDERHRPKSLLGPIAVREEYQREILLANAEAHRFSLAVHKRKRKSRMQG